MPQACSVRRDAKKAAQERVPTLQTAAVPPNILWW